MNKLEFSDLNKFLTSVGLIFIGIAFLLPWYINQNSDLIVLEQTKIDSSTKTAQNIIDNQQNYLNYISENLICIVITLLIVGTTLLAWGIIRWNKRQNVRDAKENEELNALKKQNITEQEKKDIIKGEIDSEIESINTDKTQVVQNYLDIENLIYLKISNYYTVNYINRQNIKIGKFNYDIIMESKHIQKRGDLIIEIKYITNADTYSKFIDSINQFLFAVNHYESTQERSVIPIIVFVLNEKTNESNLEPIKTKLKRYSSNIRGNLRLKIIEEKKLELMEAPKILENE
ncbi:MAG: hypothetical protein OQJ96_09405 [Flavobacteriales bacterium]|nr:hypothetical protein [Flavobacteriales bacterium]MCW8912099.1 hypothetical protein [Flavobacteriales bacterium]MCW8936739.1 hypothetical protein [Flavobacteriales bacterium]MCW8941310.1 hypothetical protein [Flavobacteriales bacterium]MCW8967144.1 hypothetical protein [Flavobacteriales bacterium]